MAMLMSVDGIIHCVNNATIVKASLDQHLGGVGAGRLDKNPTPDDQQAAPRMQYDRILFSLSVPPAMLRASCTRYQNYEYSTL